MKDIILKKAAASDLKDILQLQQDIFTQEQKIPASMIPLPAQSAPQWWCALMNGFIVGAVAAWKQEDQMHWGRFAVMPAYRGLHIGTRLARFSLDDLFARQIEEIHMEAREATVKIICDLGGKVVGTPTAFYVGTVTPVVLSRKDYLEAKTQVVDHPV